MSASRLKKVAQLLQKEKADALLVWNSEGSGQPATAWLSGFSGTSSVLLMVREKSSVSKTRPPSFRKGGIRGHLITDGRYTAQAKRETKGWKIFITSGRLSALKILEQLIRVQKIQRILFDGTVTPYSVVEDLKSSASEDLGAFADVSPKTPTFRKGGIKKSTLELPSKKRILQELRVIKEKEEIELLKKAAEIACRAFMRLPPYLQVGVTEKEIAGRLEALCREEGAEGFAFPTSVASGKNGALPHATSTDKKIKKGELITIDFGIKYKGYCSDMTRMLAVGKVRPRLRTMFDAVRKAQELGCKKAKAGMTGKEIDALCRNYLLKKGLGKYFTHSTGHGVGMEVHELPHVSPTPSHSPPLKRGRSNPLPVGAVITVEPGVYIPNVGGVRVEDTLVLTKKGNVNLTKGVTRELTTVRPGFPLSRE